MAIWNVTSDDLESIAIGAGILGTGGGGNPYLGKIWGQSLLNAGKTVRVIDQDELADDALVCVVAGMGAPTVGVEKLPNGREAVSVLASLEKFIGRPIDAVISGEIGGANSVVPLVVGAQTGKPVVDADGMGRAFPELQMTTQSIAGLPVAPAAMADEKGNTIVFASLVDALSFEKFARGIVIQMGARSTLAMGVMTGAQAKAASVWGTLSLTKQIGDAIRQARVVKTSYVDAVLDITGGSELFTGKLVDVQRRTLGGFARGELVAEGVGDHRGDFLHIAFQNENLVAWRGDRDNRAEVVACVPDLICMLETETGEPITTEQLRYGLRVTVLGIPCTDKFRTPEALKVVGPAAFHYPDVTWTPMPKKPGQGIA